MGEEDFCSNEHVVETIEDVEGTPTVVDVTVKCVRRVGHPGNQHTDGAYEWTTDPEEA